MHLHKEGRILSIHPSHSIEAKRAELVFWLDIPSNEKQLPSSKNPGDENSQILKNPRSPEMKKVTFVKKSRWKLTFNGAFNENLLNSVLE